MQSSQTEVGTSPVLIIPSLIITPFQRVSKINSPWVTITVNTVISISTVVYTWSADVSVGWEKKREKSSLRLLVLKYSSFRGNSIMAAEFESLEKILEDHLPDRELLEVKRILYGKELG